MEINNSEKLKERELEVLTIVVNLAFRNGWITENHKLQFDTKGTLNEKKQSLFDIMKYMECNEHSTKLLGTMRSIDKVNPSEDNSRNVKDKISSLIFSNFFKGALITCEEYLTYESYRQLKNENAATEKVLTGSESFSNPIKDDVVEPVVLIKNPMKISPIIRNVLLHLSVKEIKKCRLISKEWSSVGLNVLTMRSNVEFSPCAEGEDCKDDPCKTPINFFQLFPATPNKLVPFTTFTICGDDNDPWRIEELEYFFGKQQHYITNIEFDHLYLVDDNWKKVEDFDITPWISKSAMAKPNNKPGITRLKISSNFDENYTKLSVNSNVLINVKELSLEQCIIIIQDGVRICPTSLDLTRLQFLKNGTKLNDLCITDVFDLRMTKNLNLVCSSSHLESEETKLSLDMSQNERLEIDAMVLLNITFKNYRSWNCTIHSMMASRIPFTEKTEMQLKELQINSEVDLSVLPQSLEKLSIQGISNETFTCSNPIVLPNLKVLNLGLLTDRCSMISQNLATPNLAILYLKNVSESEMAMDLSWIPETLEILKFTKIKVTNLMNKSVRLRKLILESYLPGKAQEICTEYIQAEEIVLSFRWDANEIDRNFLSFLQNQKSFHEGGQRIYAGRFDWETTSEPFGESPLSTCVDKKAEYYVFENQRGTAIDSKYFKKILTILKDE